MKTVEMDRDFDFAADRNVTVAYKGGHTYERVPEAQVEAIVAAGAGRIIGGEEAAANEPVAADEPAGRKRKT